MTPTAAMLREGRRQGEIDNEVVWATTRKMIKVFTPVLQCRECRMTMYNERHYRWLWGVTHTEFSPVRHNMAYLHIPDNEQVNDTYSQRHGMGIHGRRTWVRPADAEDDICNQCLSTPFCPVSICEQCHVVGSKSRVGCWRVNPSRVYGAIGMRCLWVDVKKRCLCFKCHKEAQKKVDRELDCLELKRFIKRVEREIANGNKHKDNRTAADIYGQYVGGH